MLPYRDFFEHHVPLFHFGLAALLRWFQPERDFAAAAAALATARWISAALIVATGLGLWRVAGRWRGRAAGAAGLVFFSSARFYSIAALKCGPTWRRWRW